MFGLFNKKSSITTAAQGVNLLALGAALYKISTDPEASVAEFLTDAAVHGATFLALRQDGNFFEGAAAASLNMIRLGAIWQGVTEGCTSFPLAVLAVDSVVHMWNTGHTMCTGAAEDKETTNEEENEAIVTKSL